MKRMERLEQRERELLKITFTNERKLTAEEVLELEEIRCISMIHSCLVYGSDFFNGYKNYAENYVKTLDEEKVKEIYAKEVEFFDKHATVTKDVFTDSEGCSYNSISYDI